MILVVAKDEDHLGDLAIPAAAMMPIYAMYARRAFAVRLRWRTNSWHVFKTMQVAYSSYVLAQSIVGRVTASQIASAPVLLRLT